MFFSTTLYIYKVENTLQELLKVYHRLYMVQKMIYLLTGINRFEMNLVSQLNKVGVCTPQLAE